MLNPDFSPCFALLDDSDASPRDPRSRLYTEYIGSLSCNRLSELPILFEKMQQALKLGQYAVGLFTYEFSDPSSEAVTTYEVDGASSAFNSPAEILLFKNCQRLSAQQTETWLLAQRDAAPHADPAGIAAVRASVTENEFVKAIEYIKKNIEAGDTYQVNFTYRLHFDTFGSLHALYLRLRARQSVPYGVVIALPDGRAVLSLSPELFVQHRQGELTAQPMKGTASASTNNDIEQDRMAAQALCTDEKNRAENVMIVDLLRNDFGKISAIGSVHVSELFNVTRYGSVLQMTSTIHATLRNSVHLADIFNAIYPCGSITGAPKKRTMEIIHALESEPRGIYTGAIGWFEAPTAAHPMGDFCLSVPIRTLALQAPKADGVRQAQMGVGAGIVYDSDARNEYAECLLKAQFLTGLPNHFELFETMYATQTAGCRNLQRHLQRLRLSARYFGFLYDEEKLRKILQDTCMALPSGAAHRVRIALNQAGAISINTGPITPIQEPVRLLLSSHPTRADQLFLRHKSTVRDLYDAGWRAAEKLGAFDMLFFNTSGKVTEGGRSNLFVQLNGRWYTPPLSAGVLPGVMRAVILEDTQWGASERDLTLEEVRRADKLIVCNAVRAALAATVAWDKFD